MSDTGKNKKILEVKELNVTLDSIEILKNINIKADKGDIVAIIGPNGAGKTVFFKTLLGIFPHTGEIIWRSGKKIGYVPQKLFVDKEMPLTVKDFFNLQNTTTEEALNALESVGIKHDEHHIENHIFKKPLGKLSGGQFQRILVAWAIAQNPEILLFDEPTAGIDIGGEETIYNLLSKLKRENNLTIMLISHDLHIVYKYANKVLCLNKGMVCYGEPRIVLDPESLAKLYGDATFYQHKHE